MNQTQNILERGAAEFLVEQEGYKWIYYPETGYARLDPMPSDDEAIDIQDDKTDYYTERYQKKLASKMRRSRKRARFLKKHMAGSKMLDVGCNVGIFVAACHELGLEAQGIELNHGLVEVARKLYPDLKFQSILSQDLAETGERFDGIYCSEVIEHVTDPVGFAQSLHDLLTDDGVLYLTTPQLNEYVKKGEAFRHLAAPDHKLYFDKKNIEVFLKQIGFRKFKHRFSFGGGIQMLCYR